MTICILGRQPEFGLAELEMLYGANAVRPVGNSCAVIDAPVDFTRLGSVKKSGKVLTRVDGDFSTALRKLPSLLTKIVAEIPEGKIKLGLSVYGFRAKVADINRASLHLKTTLKKLNRSGRVVPNTELELSTAQTMHNQLTGDRGVEFMLVRDGNSTVIARARFVQNIDDYRIRDRERPKRDAFVGMLPPKLAQTIINLAVKQQAPSPDIVILDPFCGTGVILQESLLMGYAAYGTDLSQKMIDFSKANLDWLAANPRFHTDRSARLEQADATNHIWRQPVSAVACEGYLGQPLGGQNPTPERIEKIVTETNAVMHGFLENIATQLTPGTRLCIAAPAWFIGNSIHHLPVTKDLAKLGFTRHTFSHVSGPLIYRRDDQITGRELLVLTKD